MKVYEKTHKNLKIEIFQDQDAESPRSSMSNLGTFLMSHRRYEFGDRRCGVDEIQEIMQDEDNICLPVFMFDHSGITLSTKPFACKWDSGQIGVIFVSKKKIKDEYGSDSAENIGKAIHVMASEIQTLSRHVEGNVYGYTLYKKDKKSGWTEIDSCWGFFETPEELAERILDENKGKKAV